MSFFTYALLAVFTQNLVFTGGIGVSRLIRAAKRPKQLLAYSLFVAVYTLLACLVTRPFEAILSGAAAMYLRPVIFAVCVSAIYLSSVFVLNKFLPNMYEKYKIMLRHCAFNGIVLSVPLIAGAGALSFEKAMGFALGAALGFMMAAFLVSIALARLDTAEIPKSLRGIPSALLYIGILSLAFEGLSNVNVFL